MAKNNKLKRNYSNKKLEKKERNKEIYKMYNIFLKRNENNLLSMRFKDNTILASEPPTYENFKIYFINEQIETIKAVSEVIENTQKSYNISLSERTKRLKKFSNLANRAYSSRVIAV